MGTIMTKRFLVFLLVANIYVTASQLPLITFIQRTPSDRIFPLYHTNSWSDYSMYLSAITQGANGAWKLTDPYTTEPTKPTFFYFFYILTGKIAGIFKIPSFIAYHAVRIMAVELYFFTLYYLSSTILGTKRGIWGALLALIGTHAPIPLFNEPQAFQTYTPWWAEFEALKRLDIMPHYLAGYAILLFIVAQCVSGRISRFARVAFTACLALLAAIIFPPAMIPVVMALPLAAVIAHTVRRTDIIHIASVVLSASIGLIIIWHENSNGFPWNSWNSWERAMWNTNPHFNWGMVMAFGVLPFFALPSVLRAFWEKSFSGIVLSIWAFLPYLLLPWIDLLGFSKYRIMTVAPVVPLAILSTQTIFRSLRQSGRKFVLIFILLITIPISIDRLANNVQVAQHFGLYSNMFIPKPQWDAVQFIKRTVSMGSVILADEYIGNIIPSVAPVTTFIGHSVHTYQFFQKKEELRRFYSGTMPLSDASAWLASRRIQYVFFGIDEKPYSTRFPYPFLENIFTNTMVTVYRVRSL